MTKVLHPLLVLPDPAPLELSQQLDLAGYRWKAANNAPNAAQDGALEQNWLGAVIAEPDTAIAISLCRSLKALETPIEPILLLAEQDRWAELSLAQDLFDEFCFMPLRGNELQVRLDRLFNLQDARETEVIRHGSLVLNLDTYQALLDGRPMDLTYMEYELLKFLCTSPGKVFSREALLSRVWGYEYYGGGRTVDVHIRRLRAKLGEEHAHLIQTVRSVGYRFGETRWPR